MGRSLVRFFDDAVVSERPSGHETPKMLRVELDVLTRDELTFSAHPRYDSNRLVAEICQIEHACRRDAGCAPKHYENAWSTGRFFEGHTGKSLCPWRLWKLL